MKRQLRLPHACAALALALAFAPAVPGAGIAAYQAVPRDAFPVFDDPPMVDAAAAEAAGLVFDRDPVIGVAHGGEAKAYPVTVMGVHELGNDSVGGLPIVVGW